MTSAIVYVGLARLLHAVGMLTSGSPTERSTVTDVEATDTHALGLALAVNVVATLP